MLNYAALGQLGGNASGALSYSELKQAAQTLAEYAQADGYTIGLQLAYLAKGVNFTRIAQILDGLEYSYSSVSSLAPGVLGEIAQAVNTTILGQALKNISATVPLDSIGSLLENMEAYVNMPALGVIVASLPQVFNFPNVGTLLSDISAEFSFVNVGVALKSFLTAFGDSLISCNQG